MSQQNPPPEKLPPLLRSDATDPSKKSTTPYSTPAADSGSGGKGCVYGLGGALGCFVLMIGLIAALVIGLSSVAGLSLNSVLGEFSHFMRIFTPGGSSRFDLENLVLPVVDELEELSELVTTRRNYVDVVISEAEMPRVLKALYGNSAVLIVVGSIEAGVDLGQIKPEDVVINNETNTMTFTLPAPRIRACYLDESQTQVVERNSGVFSKPPTDLADTARQFAVKSFLQRAQEDNILEESKVEAENTLHRLLTLAMSLDEDARDALTVQVQFSPPDPTAELPSACQ